MIRIKVTDIPTRGLSIEDSLPLDHLNKRMNEAPDNDVTFIESVQFSIHIKPEIAGAELKGHIQAKYEQPCGICLKEIVRELDQELSLTLKAKTLRPGVDRATSSEEWEDDIGIVYFDGEHIDLEEILQETLILGISPFNNNHPNCTGLPEGAPQPEQEKKVTLGDLLKNARMH